MKIVSIDPGLRNMAFCVMQDGQVVWLERVDLFDGAAITPDDVFGRIAAWCDAHADTLNSADVVVIERQFCNEKHKLSMCLMQIQTVLQVYSRNKHLLVHAATIKKRYGTARSKHRQNKEAAVECVRRLYPEIDAHKGKIDDLCDAYLLAHYALTTFSKSFLNSLTKFSNGECKA